MLDYEKDKLLPSEEDQRKSSFDFFKFYLIIVFVVITVFGYLEFQSFAIEESLSIVPAKIIVKENVTHLKNLIDEEKALVESNGNKIFFIESHLDVERKFEKPRQACR